MWIFAISFILLDVLMLVSIILFENNSKKIIFWALIVSLTSFMGYIVYLMFFSDKGFIKKTMLLKQKEDKIYKDLVNYKATNNKASCELINFAKEAYDSNFSRNSKMTVFDTNEAFNNDLLNEIEKAESCILIDTNVFLGNISKDVFCSILSDKQKMGVLVKLSYSKVKFKDREYFRELKNSGVKIHKFNKHSINNRYYTNNKNIIVIDDKLAYLYSQNKFESKKDKIDSTELYYKFTGGVVEDIDLELHTDMTFASKKFLPMPQGTGLDLDNSSGEFSYIATSIDNNPLDLILKAIISAKKSIVLHFDKFIPHESIIEAIKLAVKSKVSVRIMISNVNHQYGYYTSRSYVKELASAGGTCYFFDGHINSNYIVIDDEIVLVGTMSMVNQSLLCDLQDIMIIYGKQYATDFLNRFNQSVKNSYKLNNPKRVLFREKFFRKFM